MVVVFITFVFSLEVHHLTLVRAPCFRQDPSVPVSLGLPQVVHDHLFAITLVDFYLVNMFGLDADGSIVV